MGFIWVCFHLTEAVIESLTIVLLLRSVSTRAAILNQASSWVPLEGNVLSVDGELWQCKTSITVRGRDLKHLEFLLRKSHSEFLPIIPLPAHTWAGSAKSGGLSLLSDL